MPADGRVDTGSFGGRVVAPQKGSTLATPPAPGVVGDWICSGDPSISPMEMQEDTTEMSTTFKVEDSGCTRVEECGTLHKISTNSQFNDNSLRTPITSSMSETQDYVAAHSVPEEDGQVVGADLFKEREPKKHWTRRLMPITPGSRAWFDQRAVRRIYKFMNRRKYQVIPFSALLFALFLADIFGAFQVPSNIELNVSLMAVFIFFCFEFIALTLTDPRYFNSFFFWTDILGTISMLFDISWCFGPDVTLPTKSGSRQHDDTIIAVRARAAVKQVARAGRLSRVLKLLRFMPFVRGGTGENYQVARSISSKLTSMLSTRVAFLSLCIVVALPMFGMFTYPEVDDSLPAWAELLSRDAGTYYSNAESAYARAVFSDRLSLELARLTNFYTEFALYGPFEVCFRRNETATFDCQPDAIPNVDFDPAFSEPRRASSIHEVTEDFFRVSFNIAEPHQHEAIVSIIFICVITGFMSIFSLLSSRSVGKLVLEPLERMLSVVREHCAKIFCFMDQMDEDQDDNSGEENVDGQGELLLLEKVVKKLSGMAHIITARHEPEVNEHMTEDDILMLNFMQQGARVNDVSAQQKNGPPASDPQRSPRGAAASQGPRDAADDTRLGRTAPPTIVTEEGTVVIYSSGGNEKAAELREFCELFDSEDFNALDVPDHLKAEVAAQAVLSYCLSSGSTWVQTNVNPERVSKFAELAREKYLPNPFHNFDHALDCVYTVRRFLNLCQAHMFLSEVSLYWLLIAAIAHDLGHPGVNNQYLIETAHQFALTYNDRAPLENMHCATLFQVIRDPDANVFKDIEKDLYKQVRKGVVDTILATDMLHHQDLVKELALLWEMNSESFESAVGVAPGSPMPAAVVALLSESAHTLLALKAFLHCADLNNPMKKWTQCQALAHLLLDEFFAQGDLEKEAGIPVQMLNDRERVDRPNSQIGFIEFVICPMAEKLVAILPGLGFLTHNLGMNTVHWYEMWEKESKPSEEEVARIHTRVIRVMARCGMVAPKESDVATPKSPPKSRRHSRVSQSSR